MKIKMLLASGICFALTILKLQAQDELITPSRDTIILNPNENIKILVIGSDLHSLTKYSEIDSLKTLLLADIKDAKSRNAFPENSKTTHYFIHQDGRRRLKAESDDFVEPEINVEKEKAKLNLELPPYSFIIHDMKKDYDCEIYLNNPELLSQLEGINFYEGINSISNEKQLLKTNYRIDLNKNLDKWEVKNKSNSRQDMIEMAPAFGIALFGSKWSPAASLNLQIRLANKYNVPAFKGGVGITAYTFFDSFDKELNDLRTVLSYDLKLMMNTNSIRGIKPKWFGLQCSYMTSDRDDIFDNQFKFGFTSEGFSIFNFSFDLIPLGSKKSMYAMTLMLPF